MEAAGVEPASANGSYRASTCVASLSVSPGRRASNRPQTSYLNISSLTGAAPARDQPDSSTSRRPASGRQIRKRTTNRSYAANASSLLAIKVFQGVYEDPGTSARYSIFTKRVEAVTPPMSFRPMAVLHET